MGTHNQVEIFDFLARCDAYKPNPQSVERIETHASVVFLAGHFAYKVKRAVKYPFLDFSTLDEAASRRCLNELRLNRRTAPQLYLEVVPITLDKGGAFQLGGRGGSRRMGASHAPIRPGEALRPHGGGRAARPWRCRPLSWVIAAFHDFRRHAWLSPEQARVCRSIAVLCATTRSVLAAECRCFPGSGGARDLDAVEPRSARRACSLARGAGQGRLCAPLPWRPAPCATSSRSRARPSCSTRSSSTTASPRSTCSTISPSCSWISASAGCAAHANAVLNAYLEAEGEHGQSPRSCRACRFSSSMRAMIRAKVEMLAGEQSLTGRELEAARVGGARLFRLARDFLAPTAAAPRRHRRTVGQRQVSCGAAIAPHVGAFPGAVMCEAMSSASACSASRRGTRLPAQAYAAEISDASLRHLPQARAHGALERADGDRRCGACKAGGARGDRALAAEAGRSVHRTLARSPSATSCGRGWPTAEAMCPTRRLPSSMSSFVTRSARKASTSSMPAARSIEVAASALDLIGAGDAQRL